MNSDADLRWIKDFAILYLWFTLVNGRIATVRVRAKFYNISLICDHEPREEKDDVIKDAFLPKLEDVYDKYPAHDAKIVLGDINAKIGRESISGSIVGQFNLHAITTSNGIRFIDTRNTVLCSTKFQHLDIQSISN